MSHRRKVLCCCCCECRKKCNDAPWWLFVVNTSSVCMIIIACTLRTYHCNVGFGGPLSTRPLYTPWGGPVGNANTTLCVHTGFWLLLIRCKKGEHQITKWQKYFLSLLSMRARNLSINKIIWWCSFCTFFNMLENAVCNEKTLCWGFSFKKIANFLDDQQQWGMRQMISTTTRHRNNTRAPRLFVKLCFLDDITVVVVVTSMNDAASYIPTPNKGSYHLPLLCWWLLEIHRYNYKVVTQIIFLFHICANIIFMDWVGYS